MMCRHAAYSTDLGLRGQTLFIIQGGLREAQEKSEYINFTFNESIIDMQWKSWRQLLDSGWRTK
jgi:hypothetical protein